MTIRILPARLANQIAAGEVVERPASVVKELVENSLDAGATRIDIDIEKGGAKLIRIRDNGSGIDKDELGLALSRHATSKIHTLDDLEAIMSLGFRGEALASISSVSRLTLTSRTVAQEEAWSAYSEGRDMAVKLQPAAHPVGTTVEVLDLFFNTPARRKFLRTEKTEFTHIDELLKRIALSRFDVSFTLRHNGKIVRQYRAATTLPQQEKRLAAVCGNPFVQHMLRIELEHQGLKLHGWITTPEGARQQSDLQYCYVNGRMMRDKLINHAIRQSYETSLRADQFATYVLFIELDPHQVDVNVHPAKHEVRFHQARLVHDFIYQALSSALVQSAQVMAPTINEGAFHLPHCAEEVNPPVVPMIETTQQERVWQAVQNTPDYPRKAPRDNDRDESDNQQVRERAVSNPWVASPKTASTGKERYGSASISKKEAAVYQTLMQTPDLSDEEPNTTCAVSPFIETVKADAAIEKLGKAIQVVAGQYLLMSSPQGCVLISLYQAQQLKLRGLLNAQHGALKAQPLLVPLALKLNESEWQVAQRHSSALLQLGIELKSRTNHSIMVMAVPQPLRQQNLQQLLPDLLSYAASCSESQALSHQALADWLTQRIVVEKRDYTLAEAIGLIAELEQLWQGNLPLQDPHFITLVDFSASITALHS
ncbi:DNA mismatch repair endonuclease MutL [Vibrio cholerae]|uniref:DNA mismatch repair endonuclease MutL n=1 Tax=Vibrio cholerae TaxID=666 RepID=UPI0006E6909A|nr:DNA mismatch repair endonuclease MutL [Vibrio cholerae]AWB71624.1 DNA mismatch repair protein MutL [Vibrio cholerae]EGQ7691776.1 DNA mismatch repair endonuclease MutL [Vibrio cholerae]EGQ8394712.1 DNA mismatch repair endonuclease MutL [Vibrio cholerae]EGQ9963291.1 DNA mismatch repair endonuclease MutL [Vibrio cholerae]EGQ9984917.1 DNA mismatch repair endonuclease MutL [Vibrio cholerae]